MISAEAAEVRDLTRQWFHAARGGQLGGGPFSTLMSVWIAFNALYAMRFDRILGDKAQILAFAKWDLAIHYHKQFLAISDYPHSIAILAANGVHNYRNGRTVTITDAQDLAQVMEAVYQVRCNLFHGRKSTGVVRDQSLIEASRLITYRLVGALLEDDAAWEVD